MNELSTMKEQELKKLSNKINQELSDREAERHRKLEIKRTYSLKSPPDTFTFSYMEFHKEVMKLGKEDHELLKKLNIIEDKCNHKNMPKNEDVYPCPQCGEMYLRSADFGDYWHPKYKITCDNCDFTAPVKPWSSSYAAWEEFHEWLVKKGYLKKEKIQPEHICNTNKGVKTHGR